MCRIVRMRADGSEAHFVADGGRSEARNPGSIGGSGDWTDVRWYYSRKRR